MLLLKIIKKILIVDDEPDIGLIPKLVLENNGYMVDYYYNFVPPYMNAI
jgi:DNA-binding response OmpR family regulator